MFDDVPQLLSLKVAAGAPDLDLRERESVYLYASRCLIHYYTGKDVANAGQDPYLAHSTAVGDELWHAHVNRVISLAETLFMFRSAAGFDEISRRLKERSVQAPFFEMMAAKQFYKAGFEIEVRPEKQNAGRNFEFSARLSDSYVNVEVKALTRSSFSESTIINALNDARKQLPTDAASIIFCVLPPSWVENFNHWNDDLHPIAARFLRGTQRVSALVFWAEKHIEYPGVQGGGWGLLRQSFKNDRARHQARGVDFLYTGRPIAEILPRNNSPQTVELLRRRSLDKLFYRWVDYLTPSEGRSAIKFSAFY